MKTMHLFGLAGFGALLLAGLGLTAFSPNTRSVHAAQENVAPAPVEDDMHEFMEYVFQPAYKRLKAAMAQQPADNQTWKTIKSDGLILAEGGNLLLIRTPEEEGGAWNQSSVEVRELGGKLYRAAKKKDYESAQTHYKAMLVSCNKCHQDFAGGEHQLTQ